MRQLQAMEAEQHRLRLPLCCSRKAIEAEEFLAANWLDPHDQTTDKRGTLGSLLSLSATEDSGPCPTRMAHEKWQDMPQRKQRTARILGFGRQTWDARFSDATTLKDGKSKEFEDKSWADMSTHQQNAAQLLGYDEQIWNSQTGPVSKNPVCVSVRESMLSGITQGLLDDQQPSGLSGRCVQLIEKAQGFAYRTFLGSRLRATGTCIWSLLSASYTIHCVIRWA